MRSCCTRYMRTQVGGDEHVWVLCMAPKYVALCGEGHMGFGRASAKNK
jgi:hypothetical protein